MADGGTTPQSSQLQGKEVKSRNLEGGKGGGMSRLYGIQLLREERD